jgi:hypothetical protein
MLLSFIPRGRRMCSFTECHVAVGELLSGIEQELLVGKTTNETFERSLVVLRFVPVVVLDIRHAGRVGQELTDGKRGVTFVVHLEVWEIFHNAIIQGEFLLLEELHDRCRYKRFGYRCHVKERSFGDLSSCFEIHHAKAPRVKELLIFNDANGQPRRFRHEKNALELLVELF